MNPAFDARKIFQPLNYKHCCFSSQNVKETEPTKQSLFSLGCYEKTDALSSGIFG